MPLTLHSDQQNAAEEIATHWLNGTRRVLLVMPTGTGKTYVAAEMARRELLAGGKVLIVGHRREILNQIDGRLIQHGMLPASLRAGQQVPQGNVIVASLHMLRKRWPDDVTLVIFDEGHVNTNALVRFQRKLAKTAVFNTLVLTATPTRLDGQPLSLVADVMVLGLSMQEYVDRGDLVPCEIYWAESPDLHGLPMSCGDFRPDELGRRFQNVKLVGQVAPNWRRHADGKRTLLFACTIEHSRQVRDSLREAGIRAEHLDGDTTTAERDRLFQALREHTIDVLCTVGVAIEGLDLHEIECVYWLRSTNSVSVFLQGTGRGMRRANHIGKDRLIVIDGAGNVWMHGPPTEMRAWSLSSPYARSPQQRALPWRTCPDCSRMYLATAGACCPNCGAVPVPRTIELPQPCDATLVLRGHGTGAEDRAILSQLVSSGCSIAEIAQQRGLEEGTVRARLRSYGIALLVRPRLPTQLDPVALTTLLDQHAGQVKAVALALAVSQSTVLAAMEMHGIPVRVRRSRAQRVQITDVAERIEALKPRLRVTYDTLQQLGPSTAGAVSNALISAGAISARDDAHLTLRHLCEYGLVSRAAALMPVHSVGRKTYTRTQMVYSLVN